VRSRAHSGPRTDLAPESRQAGVSAAAVKFDRVRRQSRVKLDLCRVAANTAVAAVAAPACSRRLEGGRPALRSGPL